MTDCSGIEQVYPNLRSAALEIFRTKGVVGLYAGLTPSLVEIVPYAGLQFGSYDTFKRWTLVSNLVLVSSSRVVNPV